ncbi:UDP-N-acetylmuramate--alanine ligase [Parelusimicrobium proximum]|uniref:UDP-N-acetylmuramate--L-alanine ligase n=1 Tax=Parelusimicrobium proximum TaxID=3228953 RepID=UPI003D1677E7
MRIHFVGIGGIGMSALAQLYAMSGDEVSGSDRLISKGHTDLPVFNSLRKLGVKLFPQDGSGVDDSIDIVVLTSAIESDNVELVKARELGITVKHRSDLLAEQVEKNKTIAISGTSGKSTVTAMVFEMLREAGKDPSVITGATLLSLQESGLYGNVYKGDSNILVIEADESDGSLVSYHPEIGVCLNIQKDHKELDVLKEYFKTFSKNCKSFIYYNEDENIKGLFTKGTTYGILKGDVKADKINITGQETKFTVDGQEFSMSMIGLHNVANALAAISVCKQLGVDLSFCAEALRKFKGVYRRFNILGKVNGIEVVDDFAHNPHKINATLKAAQLRGKRVFAFFQPHAFASIKLLSADFIAEISDGVRAEDRFYLTEVYYPGGTIPEGVSAEIVYKGLKDKNHENVFYSPCREDLAEKIISEAQKGDIILVLGARDPSLTRFAKDMLIKISEKSKQHKCHCTDCLIGKSCLKSVNS